VKTETATEALERAEYSHEPVRVITGCTGATADAANFADCMSYTGFLSVQQDWHPNP
jgi:hypothetical protein